MVETKTVDLNRNGSLIDPNFSGYKLSLDTISVVREELQDGPAHRQPTTEMFGFLHAKTFGEHNHLFLDTFSENRVYYISGEGNVCTVNEEGCPSEVWTIPETGEPHVYNAAVVFVSENICLVSDGSGTFFILETGDRREECMWKSVFQDAVCGKERPFVVRYGCVQNEGKSLEVVLQYIEDPDNMEVTGLTSKSKTETHFFNCLEWISFTYEQRGWQMDRVRRVVSHGGFNYVSITADNLAVSAEKKTVLSFDSLNPVEESLDLDEIQQQPEENAKFYWRQDDEDVEIWFYISPETTKAQVKIDLSDVNIDVRIAGVELLKGKLWQKVENDSWTWTFDHGKVGIMMSKQNPGAWSKIWSSDEEGPRGQEVKDNTEDTILPHLTSDNPITLGDTSSEPVFNSQELESVDDTMEENSVFVWQSEATNQTIASLSGNQHLMSIPVPSGSPALCIRSDVDGLVLKVEDGKLEHVATFPALGYVQASKQFRKFLVAPHNFNFSAICDDSRHIYIYRQPKPIENELRNRKTGVRVAGVAVQQVITLDNTEEILGMQATPSFLFIITKHALYRALIN